MKKLVWIGMFVTTMAAAQIQGPVGLWPIESFRLQGTGTIEDDIDWILDPIDIQRVEGYRIYTNLSNLINYRETLLGSTTRDQYLLGFSGQLIPMLPALKSAVLVEKSRLETGNPVSLMFPGGSVQGDGFIEATFKDWTGPTSESYGFWRKSARNEYATEGHIYLMNNSINTGSYAIGLCVPFWDRDYSYTTASHNFQYAHRTVGAGDDSFEDHYEFYSATDSAVVIRTDDKGEFSRVEGLAQIPIELGIATPFEILGFGIQGRLFVNPFNFTYDVSDRFTADHDSIPHVQNITRSFTETENISVEAGDKGKIFFLAGAGRKDFRRKSGKEDESKTSLPGYLEVGVSVGLLTGSIDSTRTNSFDKTWQTGADTIIAVSTRDYDDVTDCSGDLSGITLQTGVKGVFPLGSSVLLGSRCDVIYQTTNRDGDLDMTNTHRRKFDDGDKESDDWDDYEITTTTTEKGDLKSEGKLLTCKCPVGLEYQFTKNKNWAFRLGAVPTFSRSRIEYTLKTADRPTMTNIETRGDGTADTTTTWGDLFETQTEESFAYTQQTLYTYGLGWYPTKHLQVDLLAFLDGTGSLFDLVTYRSLRLSVTVKVP